ncbi:hypothetical protein AHAS_Ahas01G0086000 [Arachis hypogaea]
MASPKNRRPRRSPATTATSAYISSKFWIAGNNMPDVLTSSLRKMETGLSSLKNLHR